MATRPRSGSKSRKRKTRSRVTPRWIANDTESEAMAKRRCLLILSVLSGEKPVTDAVTELGISRPTYYKLETQALRGMLAALSPDGGTPAEAAGKAQQQIAALEAKIETLERLRRRSERLLLLTRKAIGPGPMTTGRGRKPRKMTGTTSKSRTTTTTTTATATSSSRASRRRRDGEAGRSPGSES